MIVIKRCPQVVFADLIILCRLTSGQLFSHCSHQNALHVFFCLFSETAKTCLLAPPPRGEHKLVTLTWGRSSCLMTLQASDNVLKMICYDFL